MFFFFIFQLNHERNCLEEMKTTGTQEPSFSLNEQIASIKAEVIQTSCK